MKIKNKILSFVLALCLIVPCAVVFTACGKDKDKNKPVFNVSADMVEECNFLMENLTENIYNNEVLTGDQPAVYTVQQVKDILEDFNYYVKVGTVDKIGEINSISFGTTKFEKDKTFDLSIGNGSFIQDKAYYEDENALYVAVPIAAFEIKNSAKIIINNNEFGFTADQQVEQVNFVNVDFNFGSLSTVEAGENDGEYNVNIKSGTEYLNLVYADSEVNDIVLTKKIVSGSEIEGANDVSYGLTGLEVDTGSPIAFYPIGWLEGDDFNQDIAYKYNGATIEYSAYVMNLNKVVKATFNYTITIL